MKKWFYSTWLGQLWLGFLVYRQQKYFENEFLGAISTAAPTEMYEDSVQHKYQEGLAVLKRKVNENVGLVQTTELIGLAHEETEDQKKLREVMEKIYVNKGQDVKDEVSKHKMIDKRIGDFYALQKYNEERALLKQIKLAKRANDLATAERLENEWKQRFRPSLH